MKKLLLLLMLTFPFTLMGQDVKIEVDEFTGEKIISTEWERIYRGGGTGKLQTRMQLKNINGTTIIGLRIFTNSVCSCDEGNHVMFKTDKGVVRLKNASYAISGPGEYSQKPINDNLGIYLKCGGNISSLDKDRVQKIRFYFNDGYREIELKEKESEKLQEIFNEFNKAVVKAKYAN